MKNPFFRWLVRNATIINAATVGGYTWVGLTPSHDVETVLGFAWTLLLLMWMQADARRRRCVPCFDFGFLAYATFPLSIAWYCVWSRGWRGLRLLLGLFCLFFVPLFIVLLVSAAR